jgi:hypothetical protein
MRLVLPPRSAWNKQSRCHRQSPTKVANEAGREQPRSLSGGHMGNQWACVPKFGRSLALEELRRRSRPPDKLPPRWGATEATKRQTIMGNLAAQVRKINNSTIR